MEVETLVLISFILEIAEVALQYGTTLKGSVYRLYSYYSKSPFIFFASHLGYLWILFVSIAYSNLTWPIIIAVALKTFDIFIKIELIQKIFIKPDSNYIAEISEIIDTKIPLWIYMIGPLTYPYLIYLAFKGY